MGRTIVSTAALGCLLVCLVTPVQAAFVVAADLDPDAGVSFSPNLSFGGDTTTASTSVESFAVGMPAHDSIFGGDGVTLGDTYIASYTPGVDVDNFSPAPGSLLGSTTGFGTETASGLAGGTSGTYKVYVTAPSSTNVNPAGSDFTVTGDGLPIFLDNVNMNDGGTGTDLDPGTAFVGGANNAWYLLGEVQLTAGVTYTVTQAANANSYVSQRLAGVMWELQVPEPASLSILGIGSVLLLSASRRRK